MTRCYVLPPEETVRAIAAGGPLADLQVQPDRLADMSICVAEVDGQIVAYWVAWYALHLEPLWIAEGHRQSKAVVLGLIDTVKAVVLASGEPAGFSVIEEENLPVLEKAAAVLGFQPAPGRLFYVLAQPVLEPVGG